MSVIRGCLKLFTIEKRLAVIANLLVPVQLFVAVCAQVVVYVTG